MALRVTVYDGRFDPIPGLVAAHITTKHPQRPYISKLELRRDVLKELIGSDSPSTVLRWWRELENSDLFRPNRVSDRGYGTDHGRVLARQLRLNGHARVARARGVEFYTRYLITISDLVGMGARAFKHGLVKRVTAAVASHPTRRTGHPHAWKYGRGHHHLGRSLSCGHSTISRRLKRGVGKAYIVGPPDHDPSTFNHWKFSYHAGRVLVRHYGTYYFKPSFVRSYVSFRGHRVKNGEPESVRYVRHPMTLTKRQQDAVMARMCVRTGRAWLFTTDEQLRRLLLSMFP